MASALLLFIKALSHAAVITTWLVTRQAHGRVFASASRAAVLRFIQVHVIVGPGTPLFSILLKNKSRYSGCVNTAHIHPCLLSPFFVALTSPDAPVLPPARPASPLSLHNWSGAALCTITFRELRCYRTLHAHLQRVPSFFTWFLMTSCYLKGPLFLHSLHHIVAPRGALVPSTHSQSLFDAHLQDPVLLFSTLVC